MKLMRQPTILVLLALLLVPSLLFGQESSTQQEQPPLHGSVEFGIRHVWGDEYGRPDLPFTPDVITSKFNEYGDRRSGFFIRKFYINSDDILGSKNYVNLQSQSTLYKNQSYLATFGQYGKFKVQFRYDEIPHIYTNTARTLYTQTSPGVFTLPLALKTSLQAQSLSATAATTLPNFMVTQVVCGTAIPPATQPPPCSEQFITPSILRKAGTGTISYYVTPDWIISGLFSRENEVGSRPIGLILNSSPSASATAGAGAELPEPIDYFNNTVKVGTEYGKEDWGVQLGYLGSFFENNIGQLVFDNPFRATSENASNPLTGRMDLYPNNHANYVNFASAFDLSKHLRLMASLSPGWLSQNDPFLPYTTNSAINTCGDGTEACSSLAVLPARSLNGSKQTLAMNYTLVTLPWKKFQVKAAYRFYDYYNNTRVHDFTPSEGDVGVPDVTSPEENKPFGYNKKNLELTANWFFAKRSSLKAGYEGEFFDRSHRDVEHSVEHSFISALDLSPRKDLLFRLAYRHSDRNPGRYQDEAASDPTTGAAVECTSTSTVFTEEQRCHRRFDEAARLLDRADATVEYDVQKFSFDAGFQTIQINSNRPGGSNSPTPLNFLTGAAATTAPYYLYGALKDLSYIYTFDASYALSPAVSLFAEYTHERYYKRMISRNRTPTSGTQTILTCLGCDTANNDWESTYHDIFDTYAGGLDLYLGKKVYLTTYYSLAAGKGNVFSNALGDPTITTGADRFVLTGTSEAQNYPETTTRIHELGVVFKYNLTKNIMPKVEYRYQQFDNRDYQTSAMTPYMGCIGTTAAPVTGCPSATANVGIPQPSSFYPGFVVGDTSAARYIFMGVDQPSYRVHVLTATVEYHF
ncbi:MAG: MtrB/PioB family outer membrane beta-barrel protein [Acidobacteriia bacterium]|nr:MtrB/PioB family outer membrane beta-barrel protein [Terriglobia bacterium]